MTGEAVPPRRRRRRAVWRAGAGISRPDGPPPGVESDAAADASAGAGSDASDAATAATLAAADDAGLAAEPRPGPRPTPRRRRGDPSERGLRDLVGSGPSQLGPVRAMRARDLNRPTDEDLAEAEQAVALVRRHWKPPKS